MTALLIWSITLILTVTTYAMVVRLRIDRLSFPDGVLAGTGFFLIPPFIITLMTGELDPVYWPIAPYYPYEDLDTTFQIFIGWIVVVTAAFLLKHRSQTLVERHENRSNAMLILMATLYVVFSIYATWKSGLGSEGSHWHASITAAFENSATFVILKNFSNCYRVMLFGAILFAHINGRMSVKSAVLAGLLLAVFDLSMTFNRITLVFFAFLLIALYRRYWLMIVLALAVSMPIAASVSNAWPMFRGIVFSKGASLENTIEAWGIATENSQISITDVSETLGVIFEASNITVLNEVIKVAGREIPLYYGTTFIIRPLTTFVPSFIWKDKPKVFGIYVGEHILKSKKSVPLNSTLFGEAYGNFGSFSAFAIFFFIVAADFLFSSLKRSIDGVGHMAFFSGIAVWRFDANFATACIYSLIFLLMAAWTISTLKRLIPTASSFDLRAGAQRDRLR